MKSHKEKQLLAVARATRQFVNTLLPGETISMRNSGMSGAQFTLGGESIEAREGQSYNDILKYLAEMIQLRLSSNAFERYDWQYRLKLDSEQCRSKAVFQAHLGDNIHAYINVFRNSFGELFLQLRHADFNWLSISDPAPPKECDDDEVDETPDDEYDEDDEDEDLLLSGKEAADALRVLGVAKATCAALIEVRFADVHVELNTTTAQVCVNTNGEYADDDYEEYDSLDEFKQEYRRQLKREV